MLLEESKDSGEKGQNTVGTKEFIQKYANNSHKNIDSFLELIKILIWSTAHF